MNSSESAFALPQPIQIKDLIAGSFTYNTRDTYLVRPGGYCIPDKTFGQREHEAYQLENYTSSTGERLQRSVLKEEYHAASDAEILAWAYKAAADSAGLTSIIAVRTFSNLQSEQYGIAASRPYYVITVTVYGISDPL